MFFSCIASQIEALNEVCSGVVTTYSLSSASEGVGIDKRRITLLAIASSKQSAASLRASSIFSPWVIAYGKSRKVTVKPPSTSSVVKVTGKEKRLSV